MSLTSSRRLLTIVGLMAVSGIVSVLTGNWVPAAAMVPLVGMVLFALFEVLLPVPKWATRQLQGGGTMLRLDHIEVHIKMGFAVMPYNISIREIMPEGIIIQPDSQTPLRLQHYVTRDGRFSSLEGMYKIQAVRRGEWDLGSCRVVRTSILGLFERHADLPTSTPTVVQPVTAKQRGVKLRPKPLIPEGVPTKSQRRGPGDAFYSLREFMAGDSLSDVNWKATARMGKPITNEYLPDEPARYLIYLDTRPFGAEVGKEDVFERTLELGAILVEGLLAAQAHVGLVLLSFNAQFKLPANGAVQAQRLRRMILNAEPGQEAPLMPLVEAGAPHLPRRTSAILVTPNLYEPTLQGTLTFLRAHHGHVLLLVPAFPEPDQEILSAQRTAGALLNADQGAVLADLRNYTDGAEQWPPGDSIVEVLSRLGLVGGAR